MLWLVECVFSSKTSLQIPVKRQAAHLLVVQFLKHIICYGRADILLEVKVAIANHKTCLHLWFCSFCCILVERYLFCILRYNSIFCFSVSGAIIGEIRSLINTTHRKYKYLLIFWWHLQILTVSESKSNRN